jgi:hypothetical protein
VNAVALSPAVHLRARLGRERRHRPSRDQRGNHRVLLHEGSVPRLAPSFMTAR